MSSKILRLIKRTPSIDAQTIDQALHPHQIDVEGNRFRFSIPHNFSPDFPPKPIPESISISDNNFQGSRVKSLHLWRGWWDYWTPGLFSREIGSLMLSIDVFKIHPEFKRDISIRENLIEAIQTNLINTYAEHNKEVIQNGHEEFEVYLPQHPKLYKDRIINDYRWISYAVISEEGSDYFASLATPLDSKHYLSISFNEPTHGSDYPPLYTATVRHSIKAISETIFFDRASSAEQPQTDSEPFPGYNLDLWPELWMEKHAETFEDTSSQDAMKASRELHANIIE